LYRASSAARSSGVLFALFAIRFLQDLKDPSDVATNVHEDLHDKCRIVSDRIHDVILSRCRTVDKTPKWT